MLGSHQDPQHKCGCGFCSAVFPKRGTTHFCCEPTAMSCPGSTHTLGPLTAERDSAGRASQAQETQIPFSSSLCLT